LQRISLQRFESERRCLAHALRRASESRIAPFLPPQGRLEARRHDHGRILLDPPIAGIPGGKTVPRGCGDDRLRQRRVQPVGAYVRVAVLPVGGDHFEHGPRHVHALQGCKVELQDCTLFRSRCNRAARSDRVGRAAVECGVGDRRETLRCATGQRKDQGRPQAGFLCLAAVEDRYARRHSRHVEKYDACRGMGRREALLDQSGDVEADRPVPVRRTNEDFSVRLVTLSGVPGVAPVALAVAPFDSRALVEIVAGRTVGAIKENGGLRTRLHTGEYS
jgi:hypothetical protein